MRKLITFLMLVTGCNAAAVLVQTQTAFSTSGVTSVTATFGSTPSVGNTILVGVSTGSGSAGIGTVTDNQGTSNPYIRMNAIPPGTIQAALYCATATISSGTFTITVQSGQFANFLTVFALEYSGTSCTPDKIDGAAGLSTPYACGSITTLNANDLIVVMMDYNGSGTAVFVPSSGFTIEAQQTNGSFQPGVIMDQVVSATGTFTPTVTISGGASAGNCITVAMQPAKGGGGGATLHAYPIVQ